MILKINQQDAVAQLLQLRRACDFSAVAEDVRPFMRNSEHLKLWSAEYFLQVTQLMKLQ